jgi:hypothetical protein
MTRHVAAHNKNPKKILDFRLRPLKISPVGGSASHPHQRVEKNKGMPPASDNAGETYGSGGITRQRTARQQPSESHEQPAPAAYPLLARGGRKMRR